MFVRYGGVGSIFKVFVLLVVELLFFGIDGIEWILVCIELFDFCLVVVFL